MEKSRNYGGIFLLSLRNSNKKANSLLYIPFKFAIITKICSYMDVYQREIWNLECK